MGGADNHCCSFITILDIFHMEFYLQTTFPGVPFFQCTFLDHTVHVWVEGHVVNGGGLWVVVHPLSLVARYDGRSTAL